MTNKIKLAASKTALYIFSVGSLFLLPVSDSTAQSVRGASPAQKMGTAGGADKPIDRSLSGSSGQHSANGGNSDIEPQGQNPTTPALTGHSSSQTTSSSSKNARPNSGAVDSMDSQTGESLQDETGSTGMGGNGTTP